MQTYATIRQPGHPIVDFFRRAFCLHRDPRQWKHVMNWFVVEKWETRELWECQCCGKQRLFKHAER